MLYDTCNYYMCQSIVNMYTPIPLMGARGLNAPSWTFRAELGDDLLDAHRDRCRDEWERRGWLGLTATVYYQNTNSTQPEKAGGKDDRAAVIHIR